MVDIDLCRKIEGEKAGLTYGDRWTREKAASCYDLNSENANDFMAYFGFGSLGIQGMHDGYACWIPRHPSFRVGESNTVVVRSYT